MNFGKALVLLKQGKAVTRDDWSLIKLYLDPRGHLMLVTRGRQHDPHPYMTSRIGSLIEQDMLAEDWIEIEVSNGQI